jgi:hypothetical protein
LGSGSRFWGGSTTGKNQRVQCKGNTRTDHTNWTFLNALEPSKWQELSIAREGQMVEVNGWFIRAPDPSWAKRS